MKPLTSTDDVIVVGGGLAGLICALKLAPHPTTIISAAPLGQGASSNWALAGIAAPISEQDTESSHAQDTVKVGSGIVNEKMAELMVHEAVDRVNDLQEFGVPFDRDSDGNLKLTREAAHSERRIAGVGGDSSGKAIMKVVINQVKQTPSIQILEGYIGEKLLQENGKVNGIRARLGNNARVDFPAFAVVLATGGVGHLYSHTTNPGEANGQGLALAALTGAVVSDLEFIQFHPTAIAAGSDPVPLASEALRGEGARLVDGTGIQIMDGKHPDLDLAPRDIVARAVHEVVVAEKGAYLDCRDAIGEEFPAKFPTVYKNCMDAGIDPTTELIPVAPAEHYHMGGVLTDANGRTTVDRLWAAGEVASTGVHGANRLASNSLTEAAVFGARVAKDIKSLIPNPKRIHGNKKPVQMEVEEDLPQDKAVVAEIRQLMSEHVGVVRNQKGLIEVLRRLTEIDANINRQRSLKNMVLAARMITISSLVRKESRGGHYRSDYPDANPEQAKRSYFTLEQMEELQAAYLNGETIADS